MALTSFCTLCPEVEKSIFSCSLKPPQIQISGKCIDFLVFQKKIIAKSLSVLILCSFKYCFLKETKVHMENLFFKKTNFPYFKQILIIQYTASSAILHFKDKSL